VRERRQQLHNVRPISWILRHGQDSRRIQGRKTIADAAKQCDKVCLTISFPDASKVDVQTRQYNLRGLVLKPEEAADKKGDV
jgi:hypothetical protein